MLQWIMPALALWAAVYFELPQAVADAVRRTRIKRNRLYLDALDARIADPDSGLWRIAPPCGWESWKLYGPGTQHDEHGFVLGKPTATFDALNGPGREDDNESLDDICEWAVPWIEQVSGGTVTSMVDGWSMPYGRRRKGREYCVFATVAPGTGEQR